MDIHETIYTLTRYNSHVLCNELRSAMEDAVNRLKQIAEKPSVDRMVESIRYFTHDMRKWGYYRHVADDGNESPMLCSISIKELIDMAKDGTIKDGKFSLSGKAKRLDRAYVYDIYQMLVNNGYVTHDELPKFNW